MKPLNAKQKLVMLFGDAEAIKLAFKAGHMCLEDAIHALMSIKKFSHLELFDALGMEDDRKNYYRIDAVLKKLRKAQKIKECKEIK